MTTLLTQVPEIRKRLEQIQRRDIQFALKFQYLTAARASEVCGLYAFKPQYQTVDYQGHPTLLIVLKTAKRKGRERIIALPLEEKYEPWTRELLEYLEERKRQGKEKVFPFGKRTLQSYTKDCLKNVGYLIEKYQVKNVIVEEHTREANTHALRHLRATELSNIYGFDEIDLSIFCGWKLKGMAQRYVEVNWQRYYPKLLK